MAQQQPVITQAAIDAASKFIPKHDHFYDSQVEEYWDDLEKAIEAAAPHIIAANVPANGWQPIETCPIDISEQFLIYGGELWEDEYNEDDGTPNNMVFVEANTVATSYSRYL
jgi:hypothetical protein